MKTQLRLIRNKMRFAKSILLFSIVLILTLSSCSKKDDPTATINGTVYIGNYDGVFYALDAITGDKKWQVQMPDGISSAATYADGLVYISCWNKKIYALDATSGTKKWEFLHGKSNDFSAPMVVNGLIYLGGGTKLYCLDASSGVKKWEFEGDGIYDWQASPTVVGGVVYGIIRGNTGGKYGMYALDAITGVKKWGPKTDVYLSESSPAVANGIVYAGTELNGFVAIDASNGTTKWRFGSINGFNISDSSPTISNGLAFFGTIKDKKLYAIDAITGVKKWDFLTGGAIYSSPIASNGIVYFGSSDYKLYALDATTGVNKWEVMPQQFEWVESSPVIFNGLVYVGVGKSVYAYDAASGTQKWSFLSGRSFGKATACIVDNNGNVYHSGLSGAVQ
jgi:eukaryotic-like serine/threonine-protein kinase